MGPGVSAASKSTAILVIDDDPFIRSLAEAILSSQSRTVTTVASGAAGLARMAESPPHLVLLDLGLPDISGLDVLRHFRAAPSWREVRILTINPAKRIAEKPDDSGRELATALGRHGVNAIAAWSLAHAHGIAEELASRIEDLGADLLVMGGYGHSRFREFLFGGATAGMLSRMRLPVLMSH